MTGQPQGHDSQGLYGREEICQISHGPLQFRAVVQAWTEHHLGVQCNAGSRQLPQLFQDWRNTLFAQQLFAQNGVGAMDRDVERRQSLLDDPGQFNRLQVGQGNVIAIEEGKPIVLVLDV